MVPRKGESPRTFIWPRITIVTPCFNHAPYIEQTLRSVLDQGYPNLQYLVIDGGSTDGSVDIIRRYAHRLSYWVSEKDRGQTHAINKGLARADGDILAYLNSDDFYLPGALHRVAAHFMEHADTDLLHGRCVVVNDAGRQVGEHLGRIDTLDEMADLWGVWWKQRQFVQPEVFWSRRITDRIGLLREDLHNVMDYEYWLRIARHGGRIRRDDHPLAAFRITPNQKSANRDRASQELYDVVRPVLWDAQAPLSSAARRHLKAQWLYNQVFRLAADRSVARGESRMHRMARLMLTTASHPHILWADAFRSRLRNLRHPTPALAG